FWYEAHDGNRTHDLFLTKEVLCRLSYVGIFINRLSGAVPPSRVERNVSFLLETSGTLANQFLKRLAPKTRIWSGKRDSNQRPRAWKARALPTELFPLCYGGPRVWWRGEDSNLRRRTPADLQSAPFGRSGTSPHTPAAKITSPQPMARIELATY